MKKSELNQNIYLQEGNSVLVDNNEYGFLIFSLPARECCPYATELCKKICYGRNAQELFQHVYDCRKRNYNETLKDSFVRDMINAIDYNLNRKKYVNKKIIFRIHETGDFFSQNYFNKWATIAEHYKTNKKLIFQAYTKSLPFINKSLKEINIKLVFSIMLDTNKKDIDLARKLGINTFSAIPIEEFEQVQEDKKCCGSCADCKKCYISQEDMYVEYHGNRIPHKSSIARTDYGKQIYWDWKYK